MTETAPTAQTLSELVATSHIIICSGSGGVGKTTSAAVVAMEAATLGRRAVVVTIDPAKRLADALGLGSEGIGNEPKQIDGPWPGELWAVMLDTKSTFDDLVTTYSSDPEQAERILANRFYKNISGALSGTQEYMAMEKLYELHNRTDFDLVVVDTPPSRNALDFLDAPKRLTRFLDHRLYRVIMAPTRGVMKAASVAAQAFVRQVSKVVGAEVFEDAITFFQAFDGMEAGFKERADHVMLVDLARNDLGRVCDFGSVKVNDLMIIERYSHVMHIVSQVEGQLSPQHTAYDLMRATFPAGTVSGAPKIRAMQIISELEGTTRGPYAGCVGYFSFNGNLDTCITIRTALLKDGKAYVQAGGGWVNDSEPEAEFQETVNKSKAMLKAVALAEMFAKTP